MISLRVCLLALWWQCLPMGMQTNNHWQISKSKCSQEINYSKQAWINSKGEKRRIQAKIILKSSFHLLIRIELNLSISTKRAYRILCSIQLDQKTHSLIEYWFVWTLFVLKLYHFCSPHTDPTWPVWYGAHWPTMRCRSRWFCSVWWARWPSWICKVWTMGDGQSKVYGIQW